MTRPHPVVAEAFHQVQVNSVQITPVGLVFVLAGKAAQAQRESQEAAERLRLAKLARALAS